MNEEKYLLLLSSYVPFGPMRLGLLLKYFKSAKKIWFASGNELLEVGLKDSLVRGFINYRKNLNPDIYFSRLKKLDINFVTKLGRRYPDNLRGLDDAPFALYFRGKLLSRDKYAVAIVGAREMTSYGKEVADYFSKQLAKRKVTVVSGLARGVDTIVHKAALVVGGRTMAVLACGLDRVYPPENISLAREIIRLGGAVISEFPLDYPPLPANFRQRNRIISGLAKVALIIEGRAKSGTLLTASHAANQGRTVFAVPGQITSPMSQAPHFLIQNGAKIAFGVEDILDELEV